MAWESCQRLFNPISIAFNQAIAVATVGLVVNGVSVFILGTSMCTPMNPVIITMSTITI